jgi:large subunit ribosomal protein L23
MADLHLYEVLRRPVITEKSNILNDDANKYVFEVAANANKQQIREAVEVIFDVGVTKVNTMVMPAKRGRRGRKWYIRSRQWKKAVVSLEPGDKINLFDV